MLTGKFALFILIFFRSCVRIKTYLKQESDIDDYKK